jgi:FixJ family two-component response regulator
MSDKKALMEQLERSLNRVPQNVVNGSWNKSIAYKDWVVRVRKIINKGKANEATLRGLIETYNGF